MKKLAFLVEPNFCIRHYGVRNYFFTIQAILQEKYTLEFITYAISSGMTMWYKIDVEQMETGPEPDKAILIKEGQKLRYAKLNFNGTVKSPYRYYFRSIGASLKSEGYAAVLITNPWLLTENLKIEADIVCGLVYDCIANLYVFLKKEKPYDWANLHRIGYEYYNANCHRIFCITKKSAAEYKRYFPRVDAQKVRFFQPLVTEDFRHLPLQKTVKENAVILAAPFDLRKGLKRIPDLINGVSDCLDILYIFGAPRCSADDFDAFFASTRVKQIVYYPWISTESLISCYAKSKVLLFPSTEEGLGLPIMEAQICGCRVLTTDMEPMKSLILPGSRLLYGETERDIATLRDMLSEETFDSEALQRQASVAFTTGAVLELFDECLNERISP